MSANQKRFVSEKKHGEWLAKNNPEDTWGWGTPAGKLRAARRAELIMRGAELKAGMEVMEIGCGTGMFTEIFAASGADILALDLSEDLLTIARQRNLPKVEFRLSPFEEVEISRTFDAIIGSSVLHHLDMEAALPVILRLLKPGGKLSFAEPNMLNPQIFMERTFRSFFPYISADETAFVRFRLAKQLQQCGFTDINLTPFDWLHPATPQGLMKGVSGMGKLLEKTPLLREFSGSVLIVATKGS